MGDSEYDLFVDIVVPSGKMPKLYPVEKKLPIPFWGTWHLEEVSIKRSGFDSPVVVEMKNDAVNFHASFVVDEDEKKYKVDGIIPRNSLLMFWFETLRVFVSVKECRLFVTCRFLVKGVGG